MKFITIAAAPIDWRLSGAIPNAVLGRHIYHVFVVGLIKRLLSAAGSKHKKNFL